MRAGQRPHAALAAPLETRCRGRAGAAGQAGRVAFTALCLARCCLLSHILASRCGPHACRGRRLIELFVLALATHWRRWIRRRHPTRAMSHDVPARRAGGVCFRGAVPRTALAPRSRTCLRGTGRVPVPKRVRTPEFPRGETIESVAERRPYKGVVSLLSHSFCLGRVFPAQHSFLRSHS